MKHVKFIWIKRFLPLLFILFGQNIFSQSQPGSLANGIIPKVLPASPEANSLGKFGEWPISQYTGIPDISIPVYNVNVGGFSLPIQLSYHAGGVKLDEVSSWVGTNWALNAGGCISRTIVGIPDEDAGGFLYRNQRNDFLKTTYDLTIPADYVLMIKAAKQEIDVEPDIFNFNFGGMSGRFYFDKTGNFQCIPANSLKLLRSPINNTLNYSDDKHWEIADQQGNIYFFAAADGSRIEKTIVYSDVPSASQQKATGWYLTKIFIQNQGDYIYFEYIDKLEYYALTVNHSLRILTSELPNYMAAGSSWNESLKLNTLLRNGRSSGLSPNIFRSSGKCTLKKIRWRNGEVLFDAVTSRQDVNGVSCNLLDAIIINNQME